MSDDVSALDAAHAEMMAAPDDDAPRMAFYARLAASELWFLLATDAEVGSDGTTATPEVFDLAEGRFVLAFDSVERLVEFSGKAVSYAAMPGRAAVAGLVGQGVGLGVNLSVAPSSMLIPADAVDWLAETLAQGPERIEARPNEFLAPLANAPMQMLALEAALPAATGLAKEAWLCAVHYADGRLAQILAFVGAAPADEGPLARMVAEAVAFSGVDEGGLDVVFLPASHATIKRIARVGRRFDLTMKPPETAAAKTRSAPGSDPARPPILR